MTKPAAHTPSFELTLIAAPNATTVWPLVKDFLQKAIDKGTGEFTLEQLAEMIQQERMQLWVADQNRRIEAVAVTEFVLYPSTSRLRVVLVGGQEMVRWAHLLDRMERWAVANGAQGLEALVRPGMAKLLENHGFDKPYVVVLKPLQHLMH